MKVVLRKGYTRGWFMDISSLTYNHTIITVFQQKQEAKEFVKQYIIQLIEQKL